jgi:TRAP-type C4-dicarboxylate transport system permease small subunit
MPLLSSIKGGCVRRYLDRLYDGCGILAAASMIGLLVMVLLGIIDRYISVPIKGTDAYAGYLMAGAGFLALAHTFRRGEHIRVTLILQRLAGRSRRGLEIWALFAGTVLSGLFAFFSIKFMWQSHTLHDISTAMDATPLWIPQIVMAVGTLVLFVAMLDDLIHVLRGGALTSESAAALHNE